MGRTVMYIKKEIEKKELDLIGNQSCDISACNIAP
jgi:hypothetical protein